MGNTKLLLGKGGGRFSNYSLIKHKILCTLYALKVGLVFNNNKLYQLFVYRVIDR